LRQNSFRFLYFIHRDFVFLEKAPQALQFLSWYIDRKWMNSIGLLWLARKKTLKQKLSVFWVGG